jgi:hypothetical protein
MDTAAPPPTTPAAMHARDVERVRTLLRAAIDEAGRAWMPADAILDALTGELLAMAAGRYPAGRLAAVLEGLAHHLRAQETQRWH